MNLGKWKPLIFSVVGLIVAGTIWGLYWRTTLPRAREIKCTGNLRALHSLVMENPDGVRSLRQLRARPEVDPMAFVCPCSGSEQKPGDPPVCDYDSEFDRAGTGLNLKAVSAPQLFMLVWDRETWHLLGKGRGRCVLFLDGNIRVVGDDEFRELLRGMDELFPPKPARPQAWPGR